ncbi:type III secretion system chaperone [Stigmatella sp. ncwal1]|uniref:Type III secretion system chaperone n=1 Tax=Stigmatella ashevillensis TaxID=2995309 RepID=A0ABT5D0Z3_9BACT|nr:type III secretion system chaperone [Stigmatella ashevillena]MDC0707325.1 type III secretion system chaperone [Stigmatella ashevillena]
MTRDEAKRLAQALLAETGQPDSVGLNPQGFGGVAVDNAQLYFEWHDPEQALECSALIHKFRDAPKPGILEGFQKEQQAGTDTGGGTLDFEPENKSLFLSRTYTQAPPNTAFIADMKRLMRASLVWHGEVLDRVASQVFKK